LVGLHTER